MWLRRELRVFQFLYAENHDNSPHDQDPIHRCRPCKADYFLKYIIAILNHP